MFFGSFKMVHIYISFKCLLLHFILLFGTILLAKSALLNSSNLSTAVLKDSPSDFENADDEDGNSHSIRNQTHFKQFRRCKFDYDPCEGRIPECTVPPSQWNCAPDRYWELSRQNFTLNLACKNMSKSVEDLKCSSECDEQGECDSLCYAQCSCGELDWSDFNIREYSPRALTFESIKYCYHVRIDNVDLTVGILQCIQHDSQLASIRNKRENDFVIDLIKLKLPKMRKNRNGSIHFLIGHRIFRDPVTGEIISIVNTDGSPTTYGWSIINGTKWTPKHIDSPWYSTIYGPMEPNNNDTFSPRGPTPRWENCVSIEFKENGTYVC